MEFYPMEINVHLKEKHISGINNPDLMQQILPENLAREMGIAPLGVFNNELWLYAYQPPSESDTTLLNQSIVYATRFFITSYSQVIHLQSWVYTNNKFPLPSLPFQTLLDVLGIKLPDDSQAEVSSESHPGSQDFSDWLKRDLITSSQWMQLMSVVHYSPNVDQIQPSPINALLAFTDIDPRIRRQIQTIVPLWWANHTLYVGISNQDQISQVMKFSQEWPFRISPVFVPEKHLKQIRLAIEEKPLFAEAIRENQIAERLVEQKSIAVEEYLAAITLSKRTGKTLCDSLTESKPNVKYHWLETKAELLDTIAIHESDLPKNIDHILKSLFTILPYEICSVLKVLPLNFMNGVLVVGMEKFHPGLIDILREVSGYPIETRLMEIEAIESTLGSVRIAPTDLPDFSVGIPQINAYLTASRLIQPDQLERVHLPDNLSIQTYLSRLAAEGLLNEEDIAQIYAILFQIPYLSLDKVKIDRELAQRFSQSFMRENHILPLIQQDGALWVATSNPLQGQSIAKFSEMTGLRIWPLIVAKTKLDNIIRDVINYVPVDKSSPYLEKCLEYLTAKGILEKSAVPDVLKEIYKDEQPVDRAIIKYSVDSSVDIFEQFAAFRNVKYISLKPQIITKTMVDPLGEEIQQKHQLDPVQRPIACQLDYDSAKRLSALPISEGDKGVQVAFCDPIYDSALSELKERFDCKIIPVIVKRDELNHAIERVLGRKFIGSLLVEAGMITRNQLNDALNLSEKTNTRIGQALIHQGYISEKQLYTFLSRQAGLPLFNLTNVSLSKDIAETFTPDEEWEWGFLPLSKDDRTLIVGIIDPINRDALEYVRSKTRLEVKPVLITEQDFETALEDLFKEHYVTRSVSALLSRSPENSAAQVLTKNQKIWMIVGLIVIAALALWDFMNFLVGLNVVFTVIFIAIVIYKFFLIANSIGADLEVPVTDEEVAALRDDELPTYTILIPVYKEAAVLPSLLKSIENLDYPKIKLDVKVLLEQDDEETIAAFHNTHSPEYIKGVIVPTALPKTKPKACNYGLIHAKGELLVIFDAEDQPDSDQLKKVVIAFKKSPANVICMQAKLNYFNRQQNILTQWFSSEYSMWFDLFLPGLDAHNVPIPLGGTSNHFKKFALIEAGAWDPYNMTEDADLGIRLYKLGYRTKIVDSTTYEEANSNVKNWVRQRSRWVKGHIQTWLVHMRHPFQLIKDIGFKAFFSFQMVVGGNILTVILNPLNWLLTIMWILFRFDFISAMFPGPIQYLGGINLYFGNFAFTYMNLAGAMTRGYFDMVKYTLLSPVYWILMSVGGLRGAIQIITKPHYWEKTIHGLTSPEPLPEDNQVEDGTPILEENPT